MRFRADTTCGLEVFVDASFAGNWDKKDAQTGDRDTARSRHGYINLYYGCPLIWKSQVQTEIALSSTDSEYTRLSYALREAIPLMSLLDELKEHGFPVDQTKATIQCKVFEDNSGAIEIATNHKWRPQTKHLNFHPTYPHRQTTCTYPNQSRGPEHITSTLILANGLVGLYIISRRDGSAQEGVLRYPKRSGDQSRPCRIKLFLFCTVPSTTNNLMNNQDLKFSACQKITLVLGPYLIPN